MNTFYGPFNVPSNVVGLYCQIPPYGHLLNTDPSLLRTACFAPWEGKPLHFLHIQPAYRPVIRTPRYYRHFHGSSNVGVNGVWLYIFIVLINWYFLMQVNMLESFITISVMENPMAITEILILVMVTSHAPMEFHIKCLVQQAWCIMRKKINVTTPKTCIVVSIKHPCT